MYQRYKGELDLDTFRGKSILEHWDVKKLETGVPRAFLLWLTLATFYQLPPLKAVPEGVFKTAWKIKVLSYLKVWNIACVEEWLFWSSVSVGISWILRQRRNLVPSPYFGHLIKGKTEPWLQFRFFANFRNKQNLWNILNMNFENNLPKGIFGQNIRESPNGSLTADSRSLPAAILKELCHNFVGIAFKSLWTRVNWKDYGLVLRMLNCFTGWPKQWEDVFLLLSYTGVQSNFFKTNHALIALWENRLIKYIYIYFFFNRGYVVFISAQPWPEIEEFSLTF